MAITLNWPGENWKSISSHAWYVTKSSNMHLRCQTNCDIILLFCSRPIWVRGSRFDRRSEGPISNKEHPKSELSVTPGQSKFLLQLLFYIVNIESLLDQFLLPCLAILGLCHYVVGTCWPFAGPSIDICFLRVQDKRVHLAPGAGCQMNRLILGPLRESWLYFFTLFCHVQPRCEKPYLEINSR